MITGQVIPRTTPSPNPNWRKKQASTVRNVLNTYDELINEDENDDPYEYTEYPEELLTDVVWQILLPRDEIEEALSYINESEKEYETNPFQNYINSLNETDFQDSDFQSDLKYDQI